MDHIEVKAETIDQAKQKLLSQIPDGFFINYMGEYQSIDLTNYASSDTVEHAFEIARNEIEDDVFNMKEIVEREPHTDHLSVNAFTEQEAAKLALDNCESSDVDVVNISKTEKGSNGFLGFGKKQHTFSLELFYKAKVEIGYSTYAEVEAYLTDDKDAITESFIRFVTENNYEAVNHLLSRGVDKDTRDSNGATVLILSAFKGYREMSSLLIEKGIDINATDNNGFNALIVACESENLDLDLIQKLIDIGIDLNVASNGGATALMTAAKMGYLDAVELLAEKGADLNARNFEHNITPLIWAADNGHGQVVKFLLDKGADPNIKSNNGYTAAAIAQENGLYSIVNLFNN